MDIEKKINLPLMKNNITREDLDEVIKFLNRDDILLTQSNQVRMFEKEWSDWLGVKYSVFVNSGASANLITISAFKELFGLGEIIVPTLTWVSDIASVIQCGFTPVFVDINPKTLGMDLEEVMKKVSSKTKAVFITHILGYNAINQKFMDELKSQNIPLIEDVCESYGATFKGKKLGNFSLISNFSFYYAHHMSTIEGGMICTDDSNIYEILRMFRSHGMVRESLSEGIKSSYRQKYSDLNPDFIFAFPAYNMRSTEINAVIGRSQLKRLDNNNKVRNKNLKIFLENIDPEYYYTDFDTEGCCNYAFTLILKKPDDILRDKIMNILRKCNVEFRRGTSGGGNQLRQPYLRKILPEKEYENYPKVDHVHFYGFYIGNYPELEEGKVLDLCKILNDIPKI